MLKLHEQVKKLDDALDGMVIDARRKKRAYEEKAYTKVRTRMRTRLRKMADQKREMTSSSNGRESFQDFQAGYELAYEAVGDVHYVLLERTAAFFWKPETLEQVKGLLLATAAEVDRAINMIDINEIHES
jgi:hypothetical protein